MSAGRLTAVGLSGQSAAILRSDLQLDVSLEEVQQS